MARPGFTRGGGSSSPGDETPDDDSSDSDTESDTDSSDPFDGAQSGSDAYRPGTGGSTDDTTSSGGSTNNNDNNTNSGGGGGGGNASSGGTGHVTPDGSQPTSGSNSPDSSGGDGADSGGTDPEPPDNDGGGGNAGGGDPFDGAQSGSDAYRPGTGGNTDDTTSSGGSTNNNNNNDNNTSSGGGGASTGGPEDNSRTVVREDGAPDTDNPIVQRRLQQASSQIEENNPGLDRDEYQLKVTDSGHVEFGGLTEAGRRERAAETANALEGLGFENDGDGWQGPDSADRDTLAEQQAQDELDTALEGLGFEHDGEGWRPPDAADSGTPDGRVDTPGDGPDMRNQSSDGLPSVEDRLEARVARDMDGVSPGDVTVERNEEGMVAPEARGDSDTAEFSVSVDEQPESREIEQDNISGLVSGFEDTTGLNVPGDGPLAETAPTDEQFGDMDLSLGLGGEGDEVEAAADAFAGRVSSGADALATDLFEGDGAASESLGEELLSAAGRDDLGRQYEQSLSNFGQGVVTGTSNLVGSVPKLAVEGTEAAAFTATNPVTAGSRVPDAVATRAVTATEAGLDNPARTAGALVGSAAFSGGVFKATQGTRAGTAARVALQPGEELVKAGIRRGALGSRAARITPGVRMGQVDGGTTSSGGGGVTSGLAERIGEFRREVSQRTPNVRIERDSDAGRFEVEPAARAQVASELRKARRSIGDTPGQIANRIESGAESAVQRTRELDAQLGAQAAVTGRALGERASSLRDRSPTQAARDVASEAESRVEMGARRTARNLGETATDTRIGAQFRAGEAAVRARQTPDRARQAAGRTRRRAGDLPADIGLTIARARGELAERLPERPSIDGSETSSSEVFGRPGRTRDALSDFELDVSAEVDLGRPLSTDLDATPLSQRLADAKPESLPSRPNLDPRGLTVRVEASRPQRLYPPEGEGQSMTSGVVDLDGGFSIETEGDIDTSSPGESGQLSRLRGGRETQGTQTRDRGQEAVVRTQMESERNIERETEPSVETTTRPEVRAGVAGGLAGAASEPTLDDPTESITPTDADMGVESGFDPAEATEPSIDGAEATTPFDGSDLDTEPDLDTEFGFEPDTTADTSVDTELSRDIDTELDQELGRELEQELESEVERESEAEAVLFEEEQRRDTERDGPANPFSEDVFDTGIADVDDLENREL